MITLTTIAYEKNFEQILHPDSWFMKYNSPLVTNKLVVINNVDSKDRLKELIKGVNVLYVDQWKEEAKKFFNVPIYEHTLGYYYTIPYFVLLFRVSTPYVFNVSSDCIVDFKDDFLTDSIKELKKPDVIATTLPENDKTDYYTKVFSDQVFFADVAKLRKADYNTTYGGDFSPHYGGNSFERRLSCYMHNYERLRWIYKKYNYKHV